MAKLYPSNRRRCLCNRWIIICFASIFCLAKWHLSNFPPPKSKYIRFPIHIPLLTRLIQGQGCHKDLAYLQVKNLIKPPKINSSELASVQEHIISNESHLASHALSTIVQRQIAQIQEMDCSVPNLQCGHQDRCGFGCQIHHRMACLMMSYVTQRPLIHTVDCDSWTWLFKDKWSDIFQPLGSRCASGNNTMVWSWVERKTAIHWECPNLKRTTDPNDVLCPLTFGIPLDAELGELIETLSPEPFRWIIGQFAKYVMKFNPKFEKMVENWKSEIGFNNSENGTPIVGIQVHFTNKAKERKKGIRRQLTFSLEEVENYFQNLESSQGLKKNSLRRKVFVASDTPMALETSRQIYPDWDFIGFEPRNSGSHLTRKDGLFEIIRDVVFLSQSDFVVCSFSSNACRLVYEMQAYLETELSDRRGGDKEQLEKLPQSPYGRELKSLDGGGYNYVLLHHTLTPELNNMQIWKIDC